MPRDDPQVNLRLSEEENEVLEAAAWVRRKSKSDLAKAAVLNAIARYRKQSDVVDAMDARRSTDHERQGPTSSTNAR